jgi:hypothetical protein
MIGRRSGSSPGQSRSARHHFTSIPIRDLRDLAEVEKLTELPKLVLRQLVNYSQL